jgi:hypothetical protein
MLEKVTSIEEFESKIPDINWDTITNKELNEVPTIELGRIKNVLDMSEDDKKLLVFWKEVFATKLPPLKKLVWGDILDKRQNKDFIGFNGLDNESHAYNKFLPHGFTCENFDHERMHSGMGIETIEDGKNVVDIRDLTELTDEEKSEVNGQEVLSSMFYHSSKAHWLIQNIQKEGLWAPIQGFTTKLDDGKLNFQIHPGSIRSGCFEEMEDPTHELLIFDAYNSLPEIDPISIEDALEYWGKKIESTGKKPEVGLLYTRGVIEWQVTFTGIDFRDRVYAHGKRVHELSKGKPLNIYVGYDSTHNGLEKVCIESINDSIERGLNRGHFMNPTKFKPEIKLLDISKLPDYNRDYANQSTEFTYSRFLIPHLENYEGFSIFVDDDFIFNRNLLPMFYYLNMDDAVACIQYPQYKHDSVKFDGEVNIDYPKKLWSSMMIFNNGHEDCRKLTPEVVNTWTGKQLHQFEWTDKISKIPEKYIFVEGYDNPKEKWRYSGVHYTRGGPWIDGMNTDDINNLEVYEKYKNLLQNKKI